MSDHDDRLKSVFEVAAIVCGRVSYEQVEGRSVVAIMKLPAAKFGAFVLAARDHELDYDDPPRKQQDPIVVMFSRTANTAPGTIESVSLLYHGRYCRFRVRTGARHPAAPV